MRYFLFIFAVLLIGAMIPSRIAVTTSPSLEKRLFIILKKAPVRDIERGQYVMFDMKGFPISRETWAEISENASGSERTRVVKRVSCGPGDRLENRGNNYFCNGWLIGTAKDKTLSGRNTTKFEYNAFVPSGFLFVTGDHVDSLDSKYFGFVPESKVESVLISIL